MVNVHQNYMIICTVAVFLENFGKSACNSFTNTKTDGISWRIVTASPVGAISEINIEKWYFAKTFSLLVMQSMQEF